MSEEVDEKGAHGSFYSSTDDQTRKRGLWLHQKRVSLDGNEPHKPIGAGVVPPSLNNPDNGID